MSSKPTPGPITVSCECGPQGEFCFYAVRGADEHIVMSTWRSHDMEGSKADAEIAASALSTFHETCLAPQQLRERLATNEEHRNAAIASLRAVEKQRDELLAALKKIGDSSPGEDGCYYTNRFNISSARAAIAKVEGRS